MDLRPLLLPLLFPACVHTSLQSPRPVETGKSTTGIHVVGVSTDDDEGAVGVFVATHRRGLDVGEIGFNIGTLGMEGSLKIPLTERSGKTHFSLIAGAGLWAYVLPEVNIGFLAGQELDMVTLYGGFRQHVLGTIRIGDDDSGTLSSSNAIAGIELHLSDSFALVSELNYNFVALGDFDGDDSDFFFEAPLISLGLRFGDSRSKAAPIGQKPQLYPPPQPQPYQ